MIDIASVVPETAQSLLNDCLARSQQCGTDARAGAQVCNETLRTARKFGHIAAG